MSNDHIAEVDIVYLILLGEDQEFQALLSSMQEKSHATEYPPAEDHEQAMTDYGSDEEGYDRLFMDLMSQQHVTSESASRTEGQVTMPDQEDMDISME